MRKLFLLALLACAAAPALAAECEPTREVSHHVAAARERQSIILEGPQAIEFATQARGQGVPMPDADYVFLDLSGLKYEAEWIENAKDRVALLCSWQAKPASKFGELIARWAKPA